MIKNIFSDKMYNKIDDKYLTKMVFVDDYDCSNSYWDCVPIDSAVTDNGTTIVRDGISRIRMTNPNGKVVLIWGITYNWGKMTSIKI